MNPPTTSELSLYQLTQTTDSDLASLTISASTFREWVDTGIQFLIDQEIQATVWAKLPPHSRWWTTLETYYQEGLSEQIYRCNISRSGGSAPSRHSSRSSYSSQDSLIPIVLETSSQLRREHFCLILSPQLCSLMLAQEQIPAEEDPPSGLLEPTTLKVIYSFNPNVIQKALSAIKHLITITDTTSVEVLTDSVLPFPLPSEIDTTLLTRLWYQFLPHISSVSPKIKQETTQPLPSKSLTVREEFPQPLTRELSTPLTNMKTALQLLEKNSINGTLDRDISTY